MLSPDDLLHISEGAEDIAEKLHIEIVKRMIKRIMLRIGRGEDYLLTATDKWNIQNLQQAGYLLEDIQKEIANATKLQQEEIKEAMEDAGVKALDYDDKIYQQVGLSPTALPQSPELVRLMQRNYDATMGEWTNFTRTTAEQSQRLFLSELDRAYTLVSTGALSYTEAVREIVNRIVSDGVNVIYPTGHEDTVETATLRAVRTGISQATSQIQMARADEMGVDQFIVSSHLGARPSHQVWQGKVFTLEELKSTNEGMPALGTVTGLCGVNCRHSWSVWFDGMDNPFEQYDSEENRKQYEKEQRQRTLERRIRNTKREVIGLKESVDNCKDDKLKFELDMDYQRKSALLAKQNKAYREYCERNNLKPLSDRIQIAKWDRQQAAAARGAAKRYENAHGGSVAKTTKSENTIIKPKYIQEANSIGSNMLAELYESHRLSNGLSSTSYEEFGDNANNIVYANYGKVSVETANAFNQTITELSKEYDTPLQKIRTMTKDEYLYSKESFAFVTHNYEVDSAELVINPMKCKDKSALAERIKELSQNGYCANISDDLAERYVATHEFAHTLLNLEQPLIDKRNWVSADYKKIRFARKEIENVYKEYMREVRTLTETQKSLEMEALLSFDENVWKKASEASENLKKVQISRYSLINADEFMAEAFALSKLGTYQTEHSKKVMEILDKYFRKEG